MKHYILFIAILVAAISVSVYNMLTFFDIPAPVNQAQSYLAEVSQRNLVVNLTNQAILIAILIMLVISRHDSMEWVKQILVVASGNRQSDQL